MLLLYFSTWYDYILLLETFEGIHFIQWLFYGYRLISILHYNKKCVVMVSSISYLTWPISKAKNNPMDKLDNKILKMLIRPYIKIRFFSSSLLRYLCVESKSRLVFRLGKNIIQFNTIGNNTVTKPFWWKEESQLNFVSHINVECVCYLVLMTNTDIPY